MKAFWQCVVIPTGLAFCAIAFYGVSLGEEGLGISACGAIIGGAVLLTASTRLGQLKQRS